MSPESRKSLQELDCNCNDCKWMVRSLDRYNESVALHHQWQLDYFNTLKAKKIERASEWRKKGDVEKANAVLKEANAMKFQFDKSTAVIQYGTCKKLGKDVSFIPNTIQGDTQDCFEHRRNEPPVKPTEAKP